MFFIIILLWTQPSLLLSQHGVSSQYSSNAPQLSLYPICFVCKQIGCMVKAFRRNKPRYYLENDSTIGKITSYMISTDLLCTMQHYKLRHENRHVLYGEWKRYLQHFGPCHLLNCLHLREAPFRISAHIG